MTGLALRELPGAEPATEIPIRATPGAGRDGLAGVVEGALKVRVAAPPVDGAANARLLKFLARDVFCVPISTLSLSRGERGRDKWVRVSLPLAEVERVLSERLRADRLIRG